MFNNHDHFSSFSSNSFGSFSSSLTGDSFSNNLFDTHNFDHHFTSSAFPPAVNTPSTFHTPIFSPPAVNPTPSFVSGIPETCTFSAVANGCLDAVTSKAAITVIGIEAFDGFCKSLPAALTNPLAPIIGAATEALVTSGKICAGGAVSAAISSECFSNLLDTHKK